MTVGRARVSGERFQEADSREDAKTAKRPEFSNGESVSIDGFGTGNTADSPSFVRSIMEDREICGTGGGRVWGSRAGSETCDTADSEVCGTGGRI